jgi:hypothetical protein|nr:MAG TPA: hypothetical protein [Caudoviricetes sp.]
MPKWTEYTSKDTLADNDEVMLYDATGKVNKRGLMSKFWDYVVDKMSTAVISKLETNNKTIIGAINALNSDKTKLCIDSNISNLNDFGKAQTQMLSGIAYNSALNYIPGESSFANVFYIPSWRNYGVQFVCVPDSGNIYVRMNKENKWGSWIKLN